MKKIHTKRCNPYKQRVCEIFKDVPESLVLQYFKASIMIVRLRAKDPPYMRNMKVYFWAI